MIWDEANKGRQAETPDNHLARFIGRRYLPLRQDCRVLDIGPGRHGANQTYLENKGFQVVSIDFSKEARANIHANIRTHEFQPEEFDLIIDINTLCHVDKMDYGRLQSWLKPRGRFFSIMPADGTWMEHLEGKGFVWCPTESELSELLDEGWTGARFGPAAYPDGSNHSIMSWIIEAVK